MYKIFALIAVGLLIICCKSNTKKDSKKSEAEPTGINWSKDVPAKHDIMNGAAITYNDEIYVLAGVEGRFMKYNPATYQWVDLVGLPSPRTEAGVALWNDKIVVAGGVNDSSNLVDRVDYYDLKDQVWKFINPIPTQRARFSMNVYNNKLYINGGVCGTNEQFHENCNDIIYYDENDRVWKTQSRLKSGRFGHASVNIGDAMYMIGGYGLEANTGSIYLNHVKKEIGFMTDIPTSRGNFGAVAIGDYILTFGGRAKSAFSPMEKFNTITQKWSHMPDCTFWTDRFAFTRWKDRIYVFGGSQDPKQVWKGDIVFAK